VHAFNPAFDVTPPELISGIITEKGILRPPFDFRSESLGNEKEKLLER
jgi:methylthioribose-1-phosphate isomerase